MLLFPVVHAECHCAAEAAAARQASRDRPGRLLIRRHLHEAGRFDSTQRPYLLHVLCSVLPLYDRYVYCVNTLRSVDDRYVYCVNTLRSVDDRYVCCVNTLRSVYDRYVTCVVSILFFLCMTGTCIVSILSVLFMTGT